MDGAEMNRLRWRCRRGLLENDLVLERFLAAHGTRLEGARLSAFEKLLGYADEELWAIVSGRSECREPELSEVVGLLRSC